MDIFKMAEGFLKIAVENMANAIKKISIQKNFTKIIIDKNGNIVKKINRETKPNSKKIKKIINKNKNKLKNGILKFFSLKGCEYPNS